VIASNAKEMGFVNSQEGVERNGGSLCMKGLRNGRKWTSETLLLVVEKERLKNIKVEHHES
jgi:hypothetical protein